MGESSGPSCSSPSLIIPVVIIPLNSRRLEGKKIPHLSTAREQEMQKLPGKQPRWGRREGRLLRPRGLLPSLKTSDERCKVCAAQFQLAQSCWTGSCPVHPKTSYRGGVLQGARCPAEPGWDGWTQGRSKRSRAQKQRCFPTKQGLCWCKFHPLPFLSEMQFLRYSYKPACKEREVTHASDTTYGFNFFPPLHNCIL